jgi:hypothetical protein
MIDGNKVRYSVGPAYEAAIQPALWTAFLAATTEAFHSDHAGLVIIESGKRQRSVSHNLAHWPSSAQDEYFELVDRNEDPFVVSCRKDPGNPHIEPATKIKQLRQYGLVSRLGIWVTTGHNGDGLGFAIIMGAD